MRKWIVRSALAVFALFVGLCTIAAAGYAYLSRTNGSLISSGETRRYLLHVPESYDPSSPTPLVISLHGAYLWPGSQMRLTHWNALADEHGFIAVYPAAAGFPRLWRGKAPGDELATEVQFFVDLIDQLSNELNIDRSRVYATGFSNGAAMVFMLSCALPNRIAAFGMVATAIVPWEWCENRRPVPMVAFHGTADPFVPYEGGENWLTTEPLIGMEEWITRWAERNRCDSLPVESRLASDVTLRQYTGCAQQATAALYTLLGAGHIWPGGTRLLEAAVGPYSDSVDATEEMWAFFEKHALTVTSQ